MNTLKTIPKLIIIRGLPGSGKSYLADEIRKIMEPNKVVILDPDLTDYKSEEYLQFTKQLTDQQVDKKLFPYRYLRSKAYTAIEKGEVIIWNQAFTNLDLLNRTINNLQTYAQDHDTQLQTLIIELEIDIELAIERVKNRHSRGGHDVSDEAFQRFINDYTSFSEYGYKMLNLKGEASAQSNALLVKNTLEKL